MEQTTAPTAVQRWMVMGMVNQYVLNDLFGAFPNAIMNRNLEFVADPNRRVNSYFRLDNCETRTDAQCKVLEYLSREAYKSQHFNKEWRNEQVHDYHRNGINAYEQDYIYTQESYEEVKMKVWGCNGE